VRALPLALALLALVAGHAHAQRTALGTAGNIDLPVTATAPGIVVRGETGLDRLARHVAELAPGTLKRIYADLPGLPRPGSIEIRLVHRARDLGAAAPPGHGAPGWAAGVAYGDAGVVVVATRRNSDPIDVDSTVAHELAHMALDAAVGRRAPRWLHEGFAYLHSSDWSLARARTLTGMAWSGNVIPLVKVGDRIGQQLSRLSFRDWAMVGGVREEIAVNVPEVGQHAALGIRRLLAGLTEEHVDLRWQDLGQLERFGFYVATGSAYQGANPVSRNGITSPLGWTSSRHAQGLGVVRGNATAADAFGDVLPDDDEAP